MASKLEERLGAFGCTYRTLLTGRPLSQPFCKPVSHRRAADDGLLPWSLHGLSSNATNIPSTNVSASLVSTDPWAFGPSLCMLVGQVLNDGRTSPTPVDCAMIAVPDSWTWPWPAQELEVRGTLRLRGPDNDMAPGTGWISVLSSRECSSENAKESGIIVSD
ncbi:hypothetical protein ACJ73_01855 [Blastomyces percursus]|uniref:Uncharacterized protein n=1 Tax=Blastomyces percursus TaxID=1658174 RepID=A0A1J9QD60_9EURO|nr:hypothetical protein ACJ73_01855 [Blastomyces percursus]